MTARLVAACQAKPGVTGPWQVSGRGGLSPEDGIGFDLTCVDNWSNRGNFAILVRAPERF